MKYKETTTYETTIAAEDRVKLWKAIDDGDQDAGIAMIYIYTGMRPVELLEVKKANVDLAARIIVGGLKTDAGKNRRIPIHTCILPIIEQLMAEPGENLIMWKDDEEIKPMPYYRFRDLRWKPLMEKLGMKYTMHYGRHTFAAMLREVGVGEDLKGRILGLTNGNISSLNINDLDRMLIEAIDKIPGR